MPRAKSTGRKLKEERKKRERKKYAKKCPKCGQVIEHPRRIKSSSRVRKKEVKMGNNDGKRYLRISYKYPLYKPDKIVEISWKDKTQSQKEVEI